MTYKYKSEKVRFAEMIMDLRYGTLAEIGREFCNMADPVEAVWDLRKPSDWSQMMHDWAENVLDEEAAKDDQ